MSVTIASALLVGWVFCATAVVRRAERHISREALPAPWATLASGFTLVALALALRPLPDAFICAFACIALVAASEADRRTGYLFDAITLPTSIVVGTLAVASGTATNAAAGVALLVGSFGAIVVVSRGRLMGLGDVKAMYALGAAFGPLESLVAIFAACVSGTIVAILSARFSRGAEVRFGPHLALGSAFALVAGNPIVHTVMGM